VSNIETEKLGLLHELNWLLEHSGGEAAEARIAVISKRLRELNESAPQGGAPF